MRRLLFKKWAGYHWASGSDQGFARSLQKMLILLLFTNIVIKHLNKIDITLFYAPCCLSRCYVSYPIEVFIIKKECLMFKKIFIGTLIASSLALSGCASVPMASKAKDAELKRFELPTGDMAGLYIYRNSFVGQGLKKSVYIDGTLLGETANKVYFYQLITPGKHIVSTESEFSDNALSLDIKGGDNYFVEQYIKMGVFVGGAGLQVVDKAAGEKAVQESGLAEGN